MEVWELIARESIRDCIARYNANGDSGRIDQMVEVFAPDGIMETGSGRYVGRDAIHAFMSSVVERGRPAGDDTDPGVVGARPDAVHPPLHRHHADRRAERDARQGALVLPLPHRARPRPL